VPSPSSNIKLTTAADLVLLRALVASRPDGASRRKA
jgi:hypothetical protein